MKESLKLARC